jgi:galactose mutarotase-like enzyme
MPGGDESRPSDMPGGGTLVRAEGGGTLPRAGGTLARLDVAGGGWLRPCAGEGVTGGAPDGGGMVGRKARRAMRGSYPIALSNDQRFEAPGVE